MLYNYSFDHEETKAIILINKIAEAFFGVKGKKSKVENAENDKPDLKKFYKLYGDKIKTPDKVKSK